MALSRLAITVEGTEALSARLGALSSPAAAQILERATTAGAQIVLNAAAQNAPVKTGTLRRSLHTEVIESTRLACTVTVGTDLIYARFIEEGTRAHVIYPRNKQALFWPGAMHPVARVEHPGTPPRPFLEPALVRNAARVEEEILAAIDLLLSAP